MAPPEGSQAQLKSRVGELPRCERSRVLLYSVNRCQENTFSERFPHPKRKTRLTRLENPFSRATEIPCSAHAPSMTFHAPTDRVDPVNASRSRKLCRLSPRPPSIQTSLTHHLHSHQNSIHPYCTVHDPHTTYPPHPEARTPWPAPHRTQNAIAWQPYGTAFDPVPERPAPLLSLSPTF